VTVSKIEKVLAVSELGLAALSLVACAAAFRGAFFPSADTHMESSAWALLGLLLFTPLAISLGVAGWTLFRKGRWIFQFFPLAVIVAMSVFFWWADRGSV